MIRLRWLKNLLQIFNNRIEQTDEHIYGSETRNTEQKKEHPLREKDVNGRVLYHYPKGQFRFPIIPDEEDKKVEMSSQDKVEQTKENQRQIKNKQKRPFQPTKLPPAFYGIRRTEEQSPIEYELSSFTTETNKEVDGVIQTIDMFHSAEDTHQSTVENIDLNQTEQTEDLAPQKLTMKDELRSINKDSNSNENVHQKITEKQLKFEKVMKVNEDATQQNVRVNEQHLVDKPVKEIIEEKHLALTQETQVAEDVLQVDVDNNENIIEARCDNEQDEEKITIAQENESIVPEQSDLDDENPNKNTSEKIHEGNKQVQEVDQITKNRQDDQEERKIETKAPSSKKHLPFNVVMLTEDKRKLAERKKRELLQATKLNHSLEQENKKQELTEQTLLRSALQEDESENGGMKQKDDKTLEFVQNQQDNGEHQKSLNNYQFPSVQLLAPPVKENDDRKWIDEQTDLLDETLKNFHVGAKVVNVTKGPSVTRFEVQPELGVKVNKITNLSDDIKLSLAARDIRIEAPIPGKHTIGIEVPNKVSRPVPISEIILSETFKNDESPLSVALGLDISGQPIVTDLRKMPHGLIAGATGSGKSVCINTMLISLLYKATPADLKLLLIDPKVVELAPYNRIPHLISPVITDVKAATAALKWAVEEMERRYQLFAHEGVRDISRYNEQAEQQKRLADKLPYIVIIIDELADLMMVSPADVEEAICRIAQKARACGIHLIIATQRPSVDVITGLIKANIPTRIAFSVSSQVDSRTIIDMSGAERLLGRGDMLFLENGSGKPIRLQGTFVSDDEIDEVVAFVRSQQEPNYLFEQEELLKQTQINEEEDELFYDACEFIVEQGSASTSSLQRRFRIGYNRAARLIDMLEQQGFISEARGSKPRDVLISASDLEAIQ